MYLFLGCKIMWLMGSGSFSYDFKNYGSFDVSSLSANGYFYVEYSGAENELELILQSWSGGANWARVQPSETGRANDHYYAKFTYADCVKELGAGFDKLDQLHAAAKTVISQFILFATVHLLSNLRKSVTFIKMQKSE